jgi:hypothetical protein
MTDEAKALTTTTEPSIGEMIQTALQTGIKPDDLGKMLDVWERMKDREAKTKFAAALLAFQNSCPTIARNKHAGNDRFGYDYATLDYIASVIRPHLDQQGLSYQFDSSIDNGMVRVTTIIRHTGGHEERTTFSAPIDPKASMNDPQKVASATSYARRYGLMLALGLATGGEDDDGKAAGSKYITEEQVSTLTDLIADSGADLPRFLNFMAVDQLAHIAARDYGKATRALRARKERAS